MRRINTILLQQNESEVSGLSDAQQVMQVSIKHDFKLPAQLQGSN